MQGVPFSVGLRIYSIIGLSFCGRVGAGMKLRSPVNFDLATVDQIAPAAQAELRGFRCRGIMRERHPAPVQRLHVHSPERLHSLVSVCSLSA